MPISSALGSAALAPSGFGFRNLLINGAMQVAQRGTSRTGITSSGYYTADRWQSSILSCGTWTQSVENDGPAGSGFAKSLKMLCTSSTSGGFFVHISQTIEGQNLQSVRKGTASAQPLTISFWVKSNVTGTYVVNLSDLNNIRVCSSSYTVFSSGVWENKKITIPADTVGAFANNSSGSLSLTCWLAANDAQVNSGTLNTTWAASVQTNLGVGQVNVAAATDNYWQITGVQLEANPVATDFEHRPIGVELALCQRYYEKSYDTATAPGTVTEVGVHWHSGSGNGSGRHYVPIRFKVEKRANDYTVTTYDPAASSSNWRTNNAGQTGLQRTPSIEQKGTSGFVANVEDGGYSWVVGNTRGHWTVSADL